MVEKFSVLLSVYFKENPSFFKDALNSVFNQTLLPNEVVLVEDGPLTKELYDVIKSFKEKHGELKTVPLERNSGLGNALNIGLNYCSYDLVARMDTDDVCHSDRFEKEIRFMTQNEDIDIMSSWIQEFTVIDGKTINLNEKKLPQYHDVLYNYGKLRCPINHPVCVFRKSKVIKAGGYGEFPEDYYLWSRMMISGYKFYNMQECLLDFRVSDDIFKRRGGWKYLKAEFKCQKYMWHIGYLSFLNFLCNCAIRFTVRIMPNKLRGKIYSKLIRK